MNLYVRYYDGEAVVSSIDELIYDLKQFGVPENVIDDDFVDEVYEFINSKVVHPKRFRVSPRQYFILIKTNVSTLEEFKANAKRNTGVAVAKNDRLAQLSEVNPGWYDGQVTFKRVVFSPRLNKFQYKDTVFRAKVKAQSPQDCYNRIILHLQNRQDVDPRSQFPSVKGHNFTYTFLGSNPYSSEAELAGGEAEMAGDADA